jgi:hypothetical protein
MSTGPAHRWLRVSGVWLALACVSRGTSQPTAKAAAGTDTAGLWDFRPAPEVSADSGTARPRLNAGTQFTLELGRAEHGRFQGRVQYMLSGDVVVSPQTFKPVTGWTQERARIGFTIALTDAGAPPPLSIAGELQGDTILVTRVDGDAAALPFLVPGTRFVRRAG